MKAYKRLSILCIAVLLCALLPVLAGATSPGDPPEAVDPNAVYVSVGGNDATGAGSQGAPYATLAKAVEQAEDGATIELLSNLTTSKLALISEKSITIDGNGFTITRAEGFERGLDTGRGAYHPAMIEVANGSELRLENIILDDDFKQEQNEYKEQLTGDGDKKNESKVQDAIIAAYGDGKGTIILGQGTTLKNFGGMSAVRIGGNTDDDGVWYGSTLIMEAGSKIIDDSLGNRKGGVAAIWSQGGKIEMEEGSSIEKIDGRAIYLEDGGNATVNGSIQDITANGVMTSDPAKGSDLGGGASGGFGGIAVAALGNSHFTLESAGSISDIKTDPNDVRGGDVAIWLAPGSFIMEENSRMENIQTIGLVDNNGGIIEIGGTISNCNSNNVFFRLRGGGTVTFRLLEEGSVTDCTADTAMIYRNGGKIDIEIAGTVDGMNVPVLFISKNNNVPGGVVTITETGTITNVKSHAIKAENYSAVTVQGKITNCSGYAVVYEPKDSTGSLLSIEDTAVIENNNNGKAQIQVTGSLTATDAQEHVEIAPGAIKGNTTIDLKAFDVTLDEDYAAVKLGNANAAAVTAIKNELSTNPDYTGWKTYGSSAIWMQPSESSFHFTTDRPKGFLGIGGIEPGRGLYVAYVPLQADGTPDADAEVKLEEIINQETLDITLDNLTAGTSYAVMLVMSDEYVLRPDDITIYTGGDEEGFPSWTMENTKPEDGEVRVGEDTTSYTLDNLEELFTVSYYDSEGTALTDDHTPGVYAARFNLSDAASASLTIESDGSVTGLTIGGNTVRVADGTLTIRYVSDEDEASDNELTEPVVSQVPETLEDMAVAVIQDDATYHTNGSNSGLGESNGEIHLMFDDLLPTGTGGASTDRIQMLIEKAESDNVLSFDGMDYQFKYLDLVDYSNGNAWVSTDKDIIIYWPYPAGTDQDTKFTLLHFTGLHREYSLGSEEDLTSQINASVIETVSVTNTDQGIQFTLQGDAENGSFSPFALVWEEAAVTPPVTPSEPADPDDTGVSDLLDTENHNQYLFGYPEGTFGPDQNMTRAEVAQMFYNLLVDKNVAITASFEDVPADAWYAKSVNTLASMGIISGVGENRFEPERSITRAEFTSMAMKFTKGALDGTNVFSDVHSGDWFYEAVVGSIQYGWIEGYEDGTFRPENRITRVEVTSIVNKMLGRFADREFVAGHADELNAFSDVTSTHWGYYHIVEATNSHTYTKPSTNVETWTELK